MKTITVNGFRVEVICRANAKRLRLRYTPGDDHFSLTVPKDCTNSVISQYLKQSAPWMKEMLVKHPQAEAKPSGGVPAVSGWMDYQGYRIRVTVRTNSSHFILHHRPHEAFFTLTVPAGRSQQEMLAYLSENTEWMRSALAKSPLPDWQPQFAAGERHWVLGRLVTLGQDGVPCGEAAFTRWRIERLKELLIRELDRWQRIMRVSVTSVTLKSMRSRWGSCKPISREVTFSTNLCYYPENCVTEVVVHELNHIRHHGHDAAFYTDMDRYYPDWKRGHDMKKTFDINPQRPE